MTEPMSATRLAEIRKREQAAPKGPWIAEPGYPQMFHNGGENFLGEFHQGVDELPTLAQFVIHARVDVPDLLAEVDRLRARVAELEAGRNHINDLPPSKRTLAALEIIRRPVRRDRQVGRGIAASDVLDGDVVEDEHGIHWCISSIQGELWAQIGFSSPSPLRLMLPSMGALSLVSREQQDGGETRADV